MLDGGTRTSLLAIGVTGLVVLFQGVGSGHWTCTFLVFASQVGSSGGVQGGHFHQSPVRICIGGAMNIVVSYVRYNIYICNHIRISWIGIKLELVGYFEDWYKCNSLKSVICCSLMPLSA